MLLELPLPAAFLERDIDRDRIGKHARTPIAVLIVPMILAAWGPRNRGSKGRTTSREELAIPSCSNNGRKRIGRRQIY